MSILKIVLIYLLIGVVRATILYLLFGRVEGFQKWVLNGYEGYWYLIFKGDYEEWRENINYNLALVLIFILDAIVLWPLAILSKIFTLLYLWICYLRD